MNSAPYTLTVTMYQKTIIPVVLTVLVLAGVIISGCMSTPVLPAGATGIKKFNSTDEIEQYIRDSMASGQEDGYYRTIPMTAPAFSTGAGAGTSQAKGLESSMDSIAVPAPAIAIPGDYSQTNVQVTGVDEPDIVKNDARYIYTLSGSNLAIIDAYPAEQARVIWKTEIADTPEDIFITGDRLVLFTEEWGVPDTIGDTVAGNAKIMSMPPIRMNTPTTHAVIYDISDRTRPVVLKDFTIEGSYLDARMIGSTVYMITREQIYPYYNDPIIIPTLREGGRTIVRPDVWYFDNPENGYTFTSITALDAESGKELDAQTYLLGTGNILYVSPDAIYVSFQKYLPYRYGVKDGIERVQPLTVSSSGKTGTGSTPSLPADFNMMTEEQRQAVISSLRSEEQEAVRRQEVDQTSTVIHKIAIRDGKITYAAKGEVPGALDNQFSMDEYKDNLRVATTSSVYTRSGSYTYNNVYVLDPSMQNIGSLTHIAEQETIYSTRFIGDRLYMVTFRRIDPFFVIDLSNPEKPAILGKLKIPGYSDYLHPYDANHIIGIGKETNTNEWGGVSTSGVKIALFDVSDVSNPKQIDKVQIGDAGSDSAALSDHHAFLFDKGKNLLVIPVRAVNQNPERNTPDFQKQPQVWYGAYVFGLTPEKGFTLKGTVQHGSGDSGYYYYGSSGSDVKRSLYIGNVLYTMSQKQVMANALDNINTTIATIPLPGYSDIYYPVLKGGME